MKIFQIVNNICYYDATPVHPTLKSTEGKYPPDVLFVEAPDKVHEGWGYDETQDSFNLHPLRDGNTMKIQEHSIKGNFMHPINNVKLMK